MPGLITFLAASLAVAPPVDAAQWPAALLPFYNASGRTNPSPTPEGYYASGWPIALAEAACDDDEGCLTELANCGPGDDRCIKGVSLCTYSRAGVQVIAQACRTDVIASDMGKAVLADVPGGSTFTLFLLNDGTATLNGQIGSRMSEHCVETWQDSGRFCATPLVTQEDFDLWFKGAVQ